MKDLNSVLIEGEIKRIEDNSIGNDTEAWIEIVCFRDTEAQAYDTILVCFSGIQGRRVLDQNVRRTLDEIKDFGKIRVVGALRETGWIEGQHLEFCPRTRRD